MNAKKEHIAYQIGEWSVFPERLVLQKGEQEERVYEKNMQVLLTLIEADGEVVFKDQFFEKVWGDTIVSESSLNKAISDLRKILDAGREKSVIETISKKGYRLNIKVSEVNANNNIRTTTKPKLRKILTGFLIILFLSVSALLIYYKPEDKIALQLAPNGNQVVYFLKQEQGYSLLLENFLSKSVTVLADSLMPESFALAWSPRSDFVVYNATEKNKPFYAINIQSTVGGLPTFVKFAKDDYKHQTESVPENLNSPVYFPEHKEVSMNNNKVHHIFLNERDTIKVFFQEELITSFGW